MPENFNIAPFSKYCPCKECKDRHIGCHSLCSNYKLYKNKLNKLKEIENICKLN